MTPRDAESTQIAVIGAGAIGLGLGWEIARRGVEVAVFERDRAGSGASTAAAGMLAPTAEFDFEETDLLELELESLQRYPAFVERLESDSGVELDYRTEGTIIVGLERDHSGALEHLHSSRRKFGLDADWITADRARELESGLAPSIHSAIYCPSDYQVDPLRLVRALVEALRREGGRLVEGTEIDEIRIGDGVEAIVAADGSVCEADRVVLAAGARAGAVDGPPPGVVPHLRPVRGQMLSVDLGDPPLTDHVLRVPDPARQNVYLAPKSDGRLLLGATSEERGFDPNLTAGGVYDLLRGAYRALPGVYDHDLLDAWTGFRPVTLDNEPVVGPTSVDGLWLALGHGRSGILLTPATAEGLAEGIVDGAIPDVLETFTPGSHSD